MINTTLTDSIRTVNEMLAEYNLPPLRPSEIRDWGLQGGETNSQLQELVNDLVSELHSESCQAKNEWRYEY